MIILKNIMKYKKELQNYTKRQDIIGIISLKLRIVRKKYKLYKIENDYPRTNFRKNKKYLIQNEWNWDYIISAWKEIKIEFLYYAIDVSQKSEWNKNSNHYWYYSWLEKSTIESLWLPAKATLNLPKWFTAVWEGKVKINWPYNGSINNLEYQHIEIIKNFTQ